VLANSYFYAIQPGLFVVPLPHLQDFKIGSSISQNTTFTLCKVSFEKNRIRKGQNFEIKAGGFGKFGEPLSLSGLSCKRERIYITLEGKGGLYEYARNGSGNRG
jgi:hypothetical protein